MVREIYTNVHGGPGFGLVAQSIKKERISGGGREKVEFFLVM